VVRDVKRRCAPRNVDENENENENESENEVEGNSTER
jgi:hypothetical protein